MSGKSTVDHAEAPAHRASSVEPSLTFAELRESLTMHRLGSDKRGTRYGAAIQSHPEDRVFGGLLLAQAIMAGAAGHDTDAMPLSLQAEFLAGVPTDGPTTWLVEDLGSTPAMRSVRTSIEREGVPLFTAHVRYAPVRHGLPSYSLTPRRSVVAPDELLDLVDRYEGDERVPLWWRMRRPVEFRHVEPPPYVVAEQPMSAEQSIWWRAPATNDDPTLAAAVTAYASDMSVLEPVFRQTGSARHASESRILSLTHTMTFHHPTPLGHWVQMDCAVLSLAHGRARGTAEMHCGDAHLASASQLALVKMG